MAACGAGLTRRTSVRGVVLGALGWLLRLSLVLGRGEPSPKPDKAPSLRALATPDERAALACMLGCVVSIELLPMIVAARRASTQAYETPRCRYNHACQRPRPPYHRTHAPTARLPARKGSRGRHRQHPRHGTAKLPPITACPLEPTPRPFAPLNDRARQRMRAASTLDVTTGLLGALLD